MAEPKPKMTAVEWFDYQDTLENFRAWVAMRGDDLQGGGDPPPDGWPPSEVETQEAERELTEHLMTATTRGEHDEKTHGRRAVKNWWEMTDEEAIVHDASAMTDRKMVEFVGGLREAWRRSEPLDSVLTVPIDPRLADARVAWLDPKNEADVAFADALGIPDPEDAPAMAATGKFALPLPPLIVAWKVPMSDREFILSHELGHIASTRMPPLTFLGKERFPLMALQDPVEVASNMFAERLLGRLWSTQGEKYGGNVIRVPKAQSDTTISLGSIERAPPHIPWANKRKVSASRWDGVQFSDYGGTTWEVRPAWMEVADYWMPNKPHPRVETELSNDRLRYINLSQATEMREAEVAEMASLWHVCEFGAALVQQRASLTEAVIDVRQHVRMVGGKPVQVRKHTRKLADLGPKPDDYDSNPMARSWAARAEDFMGTINAENHTEKLQSIAEVKRQNVRDTLEVMEHDPELKGTATTTLSDFIDDRQRDWAETSSDKAYRQIAMQYAVAEEFGLDATIINDVMDDSKFPSDSPWRLTNEAVKEQAVTYYKDNQVMLHAYARAVYANTQAQLKEAGIAEVVLYRGMFDEKRGSGEALRSGPQEVYMNPISSWSLGEEVAGRFNSGTGPILSARVPRERVWSTARSGPGCWDEQEMLVLGGRKDRVQVKIPKVEDLTTEQKLQ